MKKRRLDIAPLRSNGSHFIEIQHYDPNLEYFDSLTGKRIQSIARHLPSGRIIASLLPDLIGRSDFLPLFLEQP